jgi:pimeloyl-ACP methyl ester carboxylesterase
MLVETRSLPRPVHKGYVDLDDGQVHYRERAGGEPAIILLHQTALSSRSFQPLLEAIRVPHRVIALDLPGFGNSFAPAGWPCMGQYADWVLAAMSRLGAGPVHLFGHHTGASVAVEIAHREPGRVRSLTLCGPVCFTDAERAHFREQFEAPLAPSPDGGHLLENWRYAAGNNAGVAAEVIHDQVVDMLLAWRARPQAYRAVADHDFASAFKSLKAPTLILTARGDYFEGHVGRCRALRRDVEVVTVGGGNLAPELDCAGTAHAIAQFLGRIEPTPS